MATFIQRERVFSLLTPLPSLLAFGRSGLFGPPLCGGSAPATPPLLQPPPHRVCGNMTLSTRCDRTSPHPASWLVPRRVPAQARQRPIGPNLHSDDHQEPTTEILTLQSVIPYPDRPHMAHAYRTWHSSYENPNTPLPFFPLLRGSKKGVLRAPSRALRGSKKDVLRAPSRAFADRSVLQNLPNRAPVLSVEIKP